MKKKIMEFKNSKGENLETTMSNDIMEMVSNITERELTEKGIYFQRNGTKFSVRENDVQELMNAQMNASEILIADGTITEEMIEKELRSNF